MGGYMIYWLILKACQSVNVILCPEVRESCLLYDPIFIFCVVFLMQGDTLAPYLVIIWGEYVQQWIINLMKKMVAH